MGVRKVTVEQIYDVLRTLPEAQLRRVLRFVEELEPAEPTGVSEGDPVAPLYRVHTAAVRTGISNLAEQHDHYLYGLDEQDA